MTELDISLDIPKMPENLTGIIAYNPALEYTVRKRAFSSFVFLGLADMTYLYYPPGHVEPGTSGVDNGTVPYLELDLQRVYDATKKLDQPPSEMADERNRYGVAFGHGRSEDRRDQAKHTLADIPEPPRQLWLKTECLCEFQGKIPQHSYTLSITFDRPVPDFPKYIKASNANWSAPWNEDSNTTSWTVYNGEMSSNVRSRLVSSAGIPDHSLTNGDRASVRAGTRNNADATDLAGRRTDVEIRRE
ncbi:MAG: hypothetical protein Q9162_006056 [Coniocarpon cinnabarinum]